MYRRKTLALVCAALFATIALSPLLSAKTDTVYDGDVVVNGGFDDATRRGHPMKFYANTDNAFVAYDWTAPTAMAGQFRVTEDGLRFVRDANVSGTNFIQQHFNGSEAPDRVMKFYGMAITAKNLGSGTARVKFELRANTDTTTSAAESYFKTVFPTGTSTRYAFTASDFGLVAGQEYRLRAVRVWIEAGSDVLLERVSVYATNGIEGRNFHIKAGGDDVLTTNGAAAVQHPGADGLLTYIVSYADDAGNTLPAHSAELCVYDLEGFQQDNRWVSTHGGHCNSAVLEQDDTRPYRTKLADGSFRYDLPASRLLAGAPAAGPFAVWGGVEVDETSGGALTTNTWQTGYLNVARNAADAANKNVSQDYVFATPVFVENGVPTPTTVIRLNNQTDTATPVGGAVYIDPKADGTITFEYAMVNVDGTVLATNDGAVAIYDAAGFASAELRPGADEFTHALYSAKGTLLADGWTQVNVPVSVFAAAKGPVTAYAYVTNNALGLSKPTHYGLAKEMTYRLSTTVAEALTYAGTPIVATSTTSGMSLAFESTLAAQPTGLFSFTNPLVNPGFEVDGLVEGSSDRVAAKTAYGGTMTSPPWFLRLDDQAGTAATDPKSTARVAPGAGTLGGRALEVKYNAADNGKSLMLGQLFATEGAQAAMVWKDASGVRLDVKSTVPMTLKATVRFVSDATQTVTVAETNTVTLGAGSTLQVVNFAFSTPVEGKLLGFYLNPAGGQSGTLTVDNVVLQGARTVLGDARTDLTDGYAMIINPVGLSATADGGALVQGVVRGAGSQLFFVYAFQAVDYTSGEPKVLPLAEATNLLFGYRTQAGHDKDVGSVLKLRPSLSGASTVAYAVVPAALAADVAAPWAYFGTGDHHKTFDFDVVQEPVSGYFSPVKNALAGSSIADHLDYAGTPVRLDESRVNASVFTAAQDIAILADNDGNLRVKVTATGATFVETAKVVVRKAGAIVGEYMVTLDNPAGNFVPGLVIPAADKSSTTVETLDTLFTTGKLVSAGDLTASFTACIQRGAACEPLSLAPLTREVVKFRADTSFFPTGEAANARYTWIWGDGTTTGPSTSAFAEKSYFFPGVYTVKLVISVPSGLTDEATQQVEIFNRNPVITDIAFSNENPTRFDEVQVTAVANDPERRALTYYWSLNDEPLPSTLGRSFALTPALLQAATGVSHLVRGTTYTFNVLVVDADGGHSERTESFTAADIGLVLSSATVSVVGSPAATYALVGEGVKVTAVAQDRDDGVTVTASFTADNVTTTLALTAGVNNVFEATTTALGVGTYEVTVSAANSTGTKSVTGLFLEVRANAAPVLNLTGPTLVQSKDEATFVLGAVDPDGRGIASIEWYFNGTLVANATGTTLELDTTGYVGVFNVTAKVTDLNGGVTEATFALAVDDIIEAAVTVTGADVRTTGTAVVVVTDAFGNAVANAVVNLTAYNPGGFAYAHATLVTGADGTVTWKIPGSFAGGLNLPGTYAVTAKASAASAPGAPVQDTEKASGAASYDVLVGSTLP